MAGSSAYAAAGLEASGGRVARVFIGETQGYYTPNLSLEDIRDNWEQIRNTDGYQIPANLPEETAMFFNVLK